MNEELRRLRMPSALPSPLLGMPRTPGPTGSSWAGFEPPVGRFSYSDDEGEALRRRPLALELLPSAPAGNQRRPPPF